MKYDLYSRVALAEDLPDRHLRRGDVASVVEHHPGRPSQEPGYSLEVFNAVGETIDVITVRESQIEPLTRNELLAVRPLATTGALEDRTVKSHGGVKRLSSREHHLGMIQ